MPRPIHKPRGPSGYDFEYVYLPWPDDVTVHDRLKWAEAWIRNQQKSEAVLLPIIEWPAKEFDDD